LHWGRLEWVVAAAVIAVNAAITWWCPLLIPPDGLDYMDGARTLAEAGGLADFVPYKAPGVAALLGAVMAATTNWAAAMNWLQTGLNVATAGLAWLTARRLLGDRPGARWLAAASLLVVGLHAVLLTYSSYLLRECGGAFLVALAGWLLVRQVQGGLLGGWALVNAAALGAVCGLGALFRENFQTFLVLGPVLVAWGAIRSGVPARRWTALAHAAIVAMASVLVIAPWLGWMHTRHGVWGVTTPKTQFNRVVNAWHNGLIDGTELPGLSRGNSDYDYVARALVLTGADQGLAGETPVDLVVESLAQRPRETEALCANLMSTAIARRPAHALTDAGSAAVSLIGLWDNSARPAAAANTWHALPLRGLGDPGATNYIFDVDGMLARSRFTPRRERFDQMLAESRVSIGGMHASVPGRVFAVWFAAFERTRPVLALMFFFGCGVAAFRRDAAALGLSAIVLVNLLGAVILMMTPTDRFAVPMIPLMVILGAYGLAKFTAHRIAMKTGAAHATPA
jgi:hypothetical protein